MSPFDGSVLGDALESGPLDFVQALPLAKKALEQYSQTSLKDRAGLLKKISQKIIERTKDIAQQIALSEGWSQAFAEQKIVLPTAKLFQKLAAELEITPENPNLQPTGLLSIIAPAPAAFRTIGERLAPGLAAGNAFLVKVPSGSPVTATLWGKILRDVGAPDGLVALIVGSSEDLGSLFVGHPSLKGVSFAGRAANASVIAKVGAEQLKKMQVSAGAKNSLLILPEADFNDLSKMLEGCFVGQGRLAWNLSQIFLPESRLEEFLPLFNDLLKKMAPLQNPEGASPWTPFVGARDLKTLNDARELSRVGHGKPVGENQAPSRFHVEPLIVKDLTHCSTLQLDELNAPVLILNTVKYTHEMAKWVNTGDFGLCASIWGPTDKAEKLALKLNVGQVWINGWMEHSEAFAGLRKSFFGIPDFRWNGFFFSDVKSLTNT